MDFSPAVVERIEQYLPILKQEYVYVWKSPVEKSIIFAGLVEQETCITLKHSKCWNPYAELKTSREYGFGLGQLTVTPKYDNFKEATKLHPSLKNWQFSDRYNATYQLRTMLFMNKNVYDRLNTVTSEKDRYAMMFSAYNGGYGGLISDRKICDRTPGCDRNLWFGHVEKTSLKAKTKVQGYGKSFFEINRAYPKNILEIRAPRYKGLY